MHQVYHSTPRGIPDAVLNGMFAARKHVFVDLLKWNIPVIDGRFEVDQFDDGNATYLVLADSTGAHLGSTRLLETSRPHIFGDLFPGLCEEPPPRAEGICEITRFCLDRSLNARGRRMVRDTLVTATVIHALDHRIRQYTAIAEMSWFQQILAFGWRCAPLGMPQACENTLIAALSIDIDAATLTQLSQAGIYAAPSALLGDQRVLLHHPRCVA